MSEKPSFFAELKRRNVYKVATAVAGIYAILGDNEQAFAWLEMAYQESDDFLVFLNIQPHFENLHSDPRFDALVQKVIGAKK